MNLGLRKLRQKDCQKCKATQGVLNSGEKKAEKQKPQEAQLKDEESRTQRGDGHQTWLIFSLSHQARWRGASLYPEELGRQQGYDL